MPTNRKREGGNIEYELYIDVFFLVNFMMDYVILAVSWKILKCPATHGSVCLGALIGSLLTCIVIILPLSYNFVKFMLFHGLINVVMIKTGLRIRWNRQFVKALVFVYISAFLVGGILGALRQYLRESSLFFVFALGSYWIVLGIWNVIEYMAKRENNRCEVLLYTDTNQLKVRALIDTGNRLRDSVTGKPVSVISKKAALKLWKSKMPEKIRYIQYHTVGTEKGIMPLVVLEKMYLCGREEKLIIKPLVAVSESEISADEYEMILNPDIL